MKKLYFLSSFFTLVTTLFFIGGCSDITSPAHSYTLVRGKVMSGARNRTAVSGGFVGVIFPAPSKWMGLSNSTSSEIPNKTVTSSDGSFTFKVDITVINNATDYPIFLAASDSAQTFTMFSQIPNNIAKAGAQLTIDINPTTTAASELICPGGVYPPPSGSYCYSDPNNTSQTTNSLMGVIDAALAGVSSALETGTPPNWQTFMTGLLSSASTFNQLSAITTAAGLTSSGFTASAIAAKVGGATLPKITEPIAGVDDNVPVDTSGTSSGACTANWTCTSAQCAAVMGGYSGKKTGFSSETSCQAWCTQYIPGGCSCSGC